MNIISKTHGPILPRTQQRLWKALRVLKSCDAIILAEAAAAPVTSAREFLGLLVRAGYVRITARAGGGRIGKVNRFTLVRNSGPKAPRRIFDILEDQNNGQVWPLAAPQRNGRAMGARRAQQASQALVPESVVA